MTVPFFTRKTFSASKKFPPLSFIWENRTGWIENGFACNEEIQEACLLYLLQNVFLPLFRFTL